MMFHTTDAHPHVHAYFRQDDATELKTKKNTKDSTLDLRILTAISQQQGSRPYQEDSFDVQDDSFDTEGWALYTVFDGHGSRFYSSHASKAFIDSVTSLPEFRNGDYEEALRKGFLIENERLRKEVEPKHHHGGTTATAVLFIKDQNKLYVANVGDSSVVMAREMGPNRALKAVQLNRDHSMDDESEIERIIEAGGHISGGRVREAGHGINMTRALGDFEFKVPENASDRDFISAKPSIRCYDLTHHDKFLLLASDGLWNVYSGQEAVEKVAKGLYGHRHRGDDSPEELENRAQHVLDHLVKNAASVHYADNVTAIMVVLDWSGGSDGNDSTRASSAHHSRRA